MTFPTPSFTIPTTEVRTTMASLSSTKTGVRKIQYSDRDGKRQTLRLGKMTKDAAKGFRSMVEHLISAHHTGSAIPGDVAKWLDNSVSDLLHSRLVKLKLCPPRQAQQQQVTLGKALADWAASRPDLGSKSQTNMKHVKDRLLAHLDANLPVASVTTTQFRGWIAQLRKDGYATATISNSVKHAKSFCSFVRKQGWRTDHPLEDVKAGKESNPAKARFVPLADVAKLMDVLPDHEWRLLVGLSRYAGLRVPGEALRLTWDDVLWGENKLRVFAPKTGQWRVLPLFPELLPLLQEAWDRAAERAVHVIVGTRDVDTNFRTMLASYITRAGLKPWPRLFHNMRASCATELVNKFPSYVAAAWLGHSEAIADEHYRQVTEEHYRKATQKSDAFATAGGRLEPFRSVAFPGNSQEMRFSLVNPQVPVTPPGCEGTRPLP